MIQKENICKNICITNVAEYFADENANLLHLPIPCVNTEHTRMNVFSYQTTKIMILIVF